MTFGTSRPPEPRQPLRGRHAECAHLSSLVANAMGGRSSVVVVSGEAGIGKTALLEFVQADAAGCQVAHAAGVEAEMELAFAGLHQLCVPFLDRMEELPGPQRDALATAFGLSQGPPPDRFLVGLAVLSLLAAVAAARPLVCLVDDVQWLDRVTAQTLTFVARRLFAEPIAMVFATRSADAPELRGLPQLPLTGLHVLDAEALLDSVVPGRLADHVRSRFIAEADGNPLAILELPRALDDGEALALAGRRPLPVVSQIEEGYVRRVRDLPEPSQRLLLVAALETLGDAPLLWRAAENLGIPPDAALPAEAADLIRIGTRVRFRHPLLRSAVRRSAPDAARHDAHRALADAIDVEADPDRRAWHRALATPGTDDAVAAELHRCAERARRRGGLAAEAAFLERAAALTTQPGMRAERALAAAGATLRSGSVATATQLLAVAESGPLSELDRARAALLHAQSRFAADRGQEAVAPLLAASRQLETLDPDLARETYLDAISAAMFAGRLAGAVDTLAVARAARTAPPARREPGPGDRLLEGLAALFTEGYRAAVPTGRAMLASLRASTIAAADLRNLWLAAAAAADLWDDESWHLLAGEHVRIARETGWLAELPLALNSRALVHLFSGELGAAASLVAESRTVIEATGADLADYGAMGVAAWRGDDAPANALIDANLADVRARGEGIAVSVCAWARAVLHLGNGRFAAAVAPGIEAAAHPRELAVAKWGLSDLVEAAARAGDPATANDALERLAERTSASGTDWALGIEARARALIAHDRDAEDLYRESVERLGRTRIRADLARSHLLLGEWLLRTDRRSEARTHLRIAHEMFDAMGSATAFGARARHALRSAGAAVLTHPPARRAELTAQEAQIARLAGDGLTNPEIGAHLFLSPHTVDWHLRKVYRKLDVRSRRELADRLHDGVTTAS